MRFGSALSAEDGQQGFTMSGSAGAPPKAESPPNTWRPHQVFLIHDQ
jgi:hypothetical protein